MTASPRFTDGPPAFLTDGDPYRRVNQSRSALLALGAGTLPLTCVSARVCGSMRGRAAPVPSLAPS